MTQADSTGTSFSDELVTAQALDQAVAALAPLGRELRQLCARRGSGRLWVSSMTSSAVVILSEGEILFVGSPNTINDLKDFLITSGATGRQLSLASACDNDDGRTSFAKQLVRQGLVDTEGLRIALNSVATSTLAHFLCEAEIQCWSRPLEARDRWVERTTRADQSRYRIELESAENFARRLSRGLAGRPRINQESLRQLLRLAEEYATNAILYCRVDNDWYAATRESIDWHEPWSKVDLDELEEQGMVEAAAGTGWPVYRLSSGALSIAPPKTRGSAAAILVDGARHPIVLFGSGVTADVAELASRARVALSGLSTQERRSIRRVDSTRIEQAVGVWHDAFASWTPWGLKTEERVESPVSRPLNYRLL
jgi:hypothetical protein